MMLEVTIGESICVRIDDDNVNITGLVPEQFEEYLARMRRQAVTCYLDLPDAVKVTPDEDDHGA